MYYILWTMVGLAAIYLMFTLATWFEHRGMTRPRNELTIRGRHKR